MKRPVIALSLITSLTLLITPPTPADQLQPDGDPAIQIVNAATSALLQRTAAYILDPAASVQQVTVSPPAVEALASCQHTPEIMIPGQNRILVGNVTVKAVCREPRWSLHVRATVRIELPVVKSARIIDRDQVIRSDDLVIQPVSLNQLRGRYFARKNEITGKMASRRISPAQVVRPEMVDSPRVIRKNDSVVIEARLNGVSVTMTGKAQEGGAINDTIQVRNSSSGKVIKARVVASGRVATIIP